MSYKQTTTVRLWKDDVIFLKELAIKNKVPYQQIVRQAINDFVALQKMTAS